MRARAGDSRRSTLSRRGFLAGLGALGLSACSFDPSRPSVAGSSGGPVDLGDTTNLTVLNWPDYIDVDDAGDAYYPGGTLDRMAQQIGLGVDYQARYGDDVDITQVRSALVDGSSPWGLIIVPNAQAVPLIAAGLIEPIPLEIIPNHVNLDPVFMTNAWDRGARYQMPWQAGITGLAFRRDAVEAEPRSLELLFDPARSERLGFITEMREAVGLAMLANGDDPSRPTEATALAGLALVTAAVESGRVAAFDDVGMTTLLEEGTIDVAMAWSGDAAQLDPEQFGFVVPDEGAVQWFDTMMIPAGSDSIGAAGRFMNFVYDPANAAIITEWTQYISPVMGAARELDPSLAADELIVPTAETRFRLYTWGLLDADVESQLEAAFAELMAG